MIYLSLTLPTFLFKSQESDSDQTFHLSLSSLQDSYLISFPIGMTRLARFLGQGLTNPSPPHAKSLFAEPPDNVAVESDLVVILAALLCALICVVGLLAVARCAWLRRGPAGNVDGGGARRRGLKKKVIQSLPKYTHHSEGPAGPTPANECAICLSEYVDGEEIRVLPQCGHRFHVSCVDTWLGSHSSCPSCRQILVWSRCRRCGEYPAVSCGGGGGGAEGGTKGGESSCG